MGYSLYLERRPQCALSHEVRRRGHNPVLTFYLMLPLHSHILGKGEAVNALSSLPVTNYNKLRGKAG